MEPSTPEEQSSQISSQHLRKGAATGARILRNGRARGITSLERHGEPRSRPAVVSRSAFGGRRRRNPRGRGAAQEVDLIRSEGEFAVQLHFNTASPREFHVLATSQQHGAQASRSADTGADSGTFAAACNSTDGGPCCSSVSCSSDILPFGRVAFDFAFVVELTVLIGIHLADYSAEIPLNSIGEHQRIK